jgi:hypothetical protein
LIDEDCFAQFSRLAAEYHLDGFSRVADYHLSFICRSKEVERRERIEREEGEKNNGDDANQESELPQSYLGWNAAHTTDTVALAQDGRNTTFMTTCTADPRWPEIEERCLPGQVPNDRPSPICRAFKACLQKLIELMKIYFGEIVCIARVVEFQKRGLPYAHIILRVKSSFLSLISYLHLQPPASEVSWCRLRSHCCMDRLSFC